MLRATKCYHSVSACWEQQNTTTAYLEAKNNTHSLSLCWEQQNDTTVYLYVENNKMLPTCIFAYMHCMLQTIICYHSLCLCFVQQNAELYNPVLYSLGLKKLLFLRSRGGGVPVRCCYSPIICVLRYGRDHKRTALVHIAWFPHFQLGYSDLEVFAVFLGVLFSFRYLLHLVIGGASQDLVSDLGVPAVAVDCPVNAGIGSVTVPHCLVHAWKTCRWGHVLRTPVEFLKKRTLSI